MEISQKRLSASISNTGQNSTDERRGQPKARKKKNSSFQTTITKSVFLYGRPNKEKLAILQQMQNSYIALINRDIELLEKNPDIVLQLVKNDKKDPQMRKLEKAIRPEGINSAFCQNAFDAAVVQVSGRLNNIQLDLLSEGMGIFAQSKVLFAMSIMGWLKAKDGRNDATDRRHVL